MTRARLADVAAQAGVSEATVSRVLNNKPLVSADTRQIVLTALDVLGFERPGHLRRSSSGLIGLITPELDNPIFPALAQIIEPALSEAGFTTVLCTQTAGGVHEDEYTQMLLDRGAAGVIFISGLHADVTMPADRYERLARTGLPMVLVNGAADGIELPTVSDDDHYAMALAVDHLVDLRHTTIGLAMGQGRFVPAIRKLAGFNAAIRRHPGVKGHIEHTVFSVEGGASAATKLIAAGATAIICGSDLMALGAISAVRAHGLDVPQDISVIGYDDSLLMRWTDPPLTTVHQNLQAIGIAAVTALLGQIRNENVPSGEKLFRPELRVRASTGPNRAPGISG